MADTKVSALTAASALDGTEEVPVVQGGNSRRTTVAAIKAAPEDAAVLTSTQANSTTTAAVATGLTTTLTAGTYLVKVWLCYQAAATTTGAEFKLHYTGTHTRLVGTWYTLTTGGAAATGIADQATTLTAQMMEGKGQRVSDAATGPMQGVDTANADQFAVFEAILVATGSGDLQFKFNSEVASSAVTLQVGTTLQATKVS